MVSIVKELQYNVIESRLIKRVSVSNISHEELCFVPKLGYGMLQK